MAKHYCHHLLAFELARQYFFFTSQALVFGLLVSNTALAGSRLNIVYFVFMAGLFLAPIAGGMFSEKLFRNPRLPALYGGAVSAMAAATFVSGDEQLFFTGLGLLIAGNAFLPTSLLGLLHDSLAGDDVAHQEQFSFFYMANKIGTLLSVVTLGVLHAIGSPSAGFVLCAVAITSATGFFWWRERSPAPVAATIPPPSVSPPGIRPPLRHILGLLAPLAAFWLFHSLSIKSSLLFSRLPALEAFWGAKVPSLYANIFIPAFIVLVTPSVVMYRRTNPSALLRTGWASFSLLCCALAIAIIGSQLGGSSPLAILFVVYFATAMAEMLTVPATLSAIAAHRWQWRGAALGMAVTLPALSATALNTVTAVLTPRSWVLFFGGCLAACACVAGLIVVIRKRKYRKETTTCPS